MDVKAFVSDSKNRVWLIGGGVVLAFIAVALLWGTRDNPHEVAFRKLKWMTGYWANAKDGSEQEIVFLAPKGSLMVGIRRDTASSGGGHYRYLRVEITPNGVIYFESPSGRDTIAFALKESEDEQAIFENPLNEYPQKVIYTLKDSKTIGLRVEGMKEGAAQAEEMEFKRAELGDD